jgi:hypothetical protein
MYHSNKKIQVYEWRRNGETLGYGMTADLERRRIEHLGEIPDSTVSAVCVADNEPEARARGRELLKQYKNEHGDLPSRNKPR